MGWWNDFVTWINSANGSRIILNAILPFLAIVVAGIVAAIIGRGALRRVVDQQNRELQGAAIIALIVVGRKASIWSSLGLDEKQHVDSLMSEADIRVRLLPVSGASNAADWAAHQLADMKKNSASFSFQAEQTFGDYRDRLLDWQNKPGRAKKLFVSDLAQWRYEDDAPASTTAHEWTPAAATSSAVTSTPPTVVAPTPFVAPAPATAETFAPATADQETVAIPTTTGSTTVTPGLADAPPPTVDAADAPPPAGVTTDA
jgi:hypothetical protein